MKIPRLIAAACAALAAAACHVPASRAAEPRPSRLTIVFTADVSGYLEPCG